MYAKLRLRKLLTAVTNSTARRAFVRTGVAPSIELEPLIRPLSVDTVVDVGANIGQFTLLALMRLQPRKVIAFEPLARPARLFEKAFGDDPRVCLHRMALGAVSGPVDIHVSRAADSSSLLPISPLQVRTFPGTEAVGVECVEVRPLREVLSADELKGRSLLKIDVQGFELGVLRGCQELLSSFDFLLIELSFVQLYEGQPLASEIIAWLRDHSFRVGGVGKDSTVQTDFLFVNETAC